MDAKLIKFLKELKHFGIKNNIPNISFELGAFLNALVRLFTPKHILEIGCANGFSTIFLADGGFKGKSKITTVDFSGPSIAQAQENLRKTNLANYVKFYLGNAFTIVPKLNQKYNFMFIDGQKKDYHRFLELSDKYTAKNGLIIFDNIMKFPKKTKQFSNKIKTIKNFEKLYLPVFSSIKFGKTGRKKTKDKILLLRKL